MWYTEEHINSIWPQPLLNPLLYVCVQTKACLEQKQAEQVKQLKQLEMESRREADIELDIQRQKNQELLEKYQTENQQLQKKV